MYKRQILDGVRAVAFKPLIEILKGIDQDLLKGAIAGEHFQEPVSYTHLELPKHSTLMHPNDYTTLQDLHCVYEGRLSGLPQRQNMDFGLSLIHI